MNKRFIGSFHTDQFVNNEQLINCKHFDLDLEQNGKKMKLHC